MLIPKSPESPPSDRRPSTVMDACYRIWSRKHAHALLKWLNSWAPPSLVGSRRGFSANTTTQEVAGIINRARAGERPPLVEYILEVYSGLGRQLWIDGAPTSSILQGEDACGIPQGCPAACFFANVSAMIWLQVVSNPRLQIFAYLDDWLLLSSSWQDLEEAMEKTEAVCAMLGSTINTAKC